MRQPVVLVILDGWGHREEKEHNAIAAANTPCFDNLWKNCPHTLLEASGPHVGLPDGQMGNSEVGHATIGAGAILDTDLVRITKAVKSGEIKNNVVVQTLFEHVKKHNSTLHLKGLIGPGGVHAHSEHWYGILRAAKEVGVEKIAIHAFTDGRDTPPQSAHQHLKELEEELQRLGVGFIASVSGRFFAMDRDNNWDRVAKVEDAIFHARATQHKTNRPSEVVKALYAAGKTDEHFEPMIFLDEDSKSWHVQDNDAILFMNYRKDRGRQLSQRTMEYIKRRNLCFATMMKYSNEIESLAAFDPIDIETTLAAEISAAGLTQAHIAETEKIAHATSFLNGGRQEPHLGEEHVLVPSRKDVKTHDEAPEMKAAEIADKVVEQIKKGTDFIFVNFANPDMVGHTGNVPAIIKGIETTDKVLQKVIGAVKEKGGIAFITADHGNAEFNFDSFTNTPNTAHTTNPVPAVIYSLDCRLHPGSLQDIAPTILSIYNIRKPGFMTGESLFN